jgi:tetratricopeptide (TPR) repeat protein
MMRTKNFLLLLLFFAVGTPLIFAQASTDCNIKYNLFKGDYQTKKYDAAFENWMWCMDNCPKLSVNIYKYGIKIAEHRLETASAADKQAAADLVMRVYTQRLEHFPQDKARVYNDVASFKAEMGASEDEVYNWLERAFKADPTDVSPKNIFKYFDMVLNRYKDSNTQLVFDTYDEVGEGIELKRNEYSKKIDAINAKDSLTLSAKDKRNRKTYQAILSNLGVVERGLDAKLAEISTCERLIPFNKKNFDEFQNDPVWLKRAVNRMYNKECTEDPFYDTLVEAYVKAEPSPNASVFYAGILMKKGETNKAMDYFKQAIEQESDPYNKAKYNYKIAQILSKKGRKSEARNYCYRALELAPTMGQAYLLIGLMYASSANSCGDDVVSKRMVYVAALNKAVKAKQVDPSISTQANKLISLFSKNLPTKKDLFVAGVESGTTFKINCWIGETVRVP